MFVRGVLFDVLLDVMAAGAGDIAGIDNLKYDIRAIQNLFIKKIK